MENLTRERAHDLCVEMWNDIAENVYKYKVQSYLIKKFHPRDSCFSCEFYLRYGSCLDCPFSKFANGCCDNGSPYWMWISDINPKDNAIAIADLFIE